MKTVLIIGMGRFGHHLARNMNALGNEIMIVDKDESRLEDLTREISNIKIGDRTNEDVYKVLVFPILIFVLFVLEQISKVVWKLQVCSKN